jgi:hypothetical protein
MNSEIIPFSILGVAKHGRFLSEEFYGNLSELLSYCQVKNEMCSAHEQHHAAG